MFVPDRPLAGLDFTAQRPKPHKTGVLRAPEHSFPKDFQCAPSKLCTPNPKNPARFARRKLNFPKDFQCFALEKGYPGKQKNGALRAPKP